MVKVKIGGVPEHFNLPWTLAVAEGLFLKQGIDLEWIEYPGGTGAMTSDLKSGKLDMAVLLTEGIIAAIANGNESKLVRWYVTSPLNWGIHVPVDSPYQDINSLQGKRYAVSRLGSGSHLMAYVDAALRNWAVDENQFVVIGNLAGALEALKNKEADIFLWEKLMTKPYVDKGFLNRVGVRPTPWPSFALAGRASFLSEQAEVVQKISDLINGFAERMRIADVPSLLMAEYGFLDDDINVWLQETHWSENNEISRTELESVIDFLFRLGLISQKTDPAILVSNLTFYRNS